MKLDFRGTARLRKTGTAWLVFAASIFSVSTMRAQELTRTIEVHARRFVFEPSTVTVRRGETVRLRLFSDDVPHSLLIRELGINVVATKSHPGETVFTAGQPGDFEGRCGRFCGPGHGRMFFTLKVTGN
jgi:cytochrome c oxidase subunit 2